MTDIFLNDSLNLANIQSVLQKKKLIIYFFFHRVGKKLKFTL